MIQIDHDMFDAQILHIRNNLTRADIIEALGKEAKELLSDLQLGQLVLLSDDLSSVMRELAITRCYQASGMAEHAVAEASREVSS